jgi:hypothetical protein
MDFVQSMDTDFIASVVERWRGAMISSRASGDDGSLEFDALASEEFSPLRQAGMREPERPVPAPPNGGTARPDSYFFPVEQPGNRLTPRLRK